MFFFFHVLGLGLGYYLMFHFAVICICFTIIQTKDIEEEGPPAHSIILCPYLPEQHQFLGLALGLQLLKQSYDWAESGLAMSS